MTGIHTCLIDGFITHLFHTLQLYGNVLGDVLECSNIIAVGIVNTTILKKKKLKSHCKYGEMRE